MNKLIPILFLVSFILITGSTNDVFAQTVVITTTTSATDLVNEIVGGGITTSNEMLVGQTTQQGTFTGGTAAGVGFESGIILTSGDANLAPGPNSEDGSGLGLGTAGIPELASICNDDSNDANLLDFDFTSQGGDLFFRYTFASDEYNEFTNSAFNDPFAFFLDGVNIALIPGTGGPGVGTPVSINTVNGGNPFGTGASNPALFNNNDLDDGGPFFNIEYDGLTDVFTAQFLGLAPGTHHIQMAISDCGDTVLDSAVFIEQGSFSDTPPAQSERVAGMLLPVDTTPLIVAGVQSTAAWMIPVLLSVAGIGLFVAERKNEPDL